MTEFQERPSTAQLKRDIQKISKATKDLTQYVTQPAGDKIVLLETLQIILFISRHLEVLHDRIDELEARLDRKPGSLH